MICLMRSKGHKRSTLWRKIKTMDIFDDIVSGYDSEANHQFLCLLEKYLPQHVFEIISSNGQRIFLHQKISIDKNLEKILWEKAELSVDSICIADKDNLPVYSLYLNKMQSLLVCILPKVFDTATGQKMITTIVKLCVELFYKDRFLVEEKELLLVHKKQRDRKIQVLEKKYEEILIENQEQSAEYSKLLHSEIQRQTGELKKSNKALIRAKEKAEAANIAKDQFLANMSHEIRTPMNSVIGFLELILEDQSIKNNIHQQLSIAHNSAQQLLSLINDILDVSKLGSGKIILENKPFKLLELINKAFETMEIRAHKKGLSLDYDIHPSISGLFSGDPFRINQVMINLIGNAIKFTRQGSVILKVIPGEKKGQFHFMIKDTGIGICADRLNKIFDPFAQADTSTTRKYGGTGLGTTISKQIVELMGGRIWAESEEGKGSIFHFIISLDSVDDDMVEEADPVTETGSALSKFNRCFQILLAEDIDANAVLVKTRLELKGHKIIVACNGREAIKALQKETFDIVLMDIHMPEMDGLEATAHIRSMEINTNEHLPIIALTASVMRGEIKKFLAAGMDSVVAKPIDFNKLMIAMEELIPDSRQREILRNKMIVDTLPESDLPRLEGVNIENGMGRWQNLNVYTASLIGFTDEYENFIDRLSLLINAGDIDQAYQITHKLKGLAGNLSVTTVADIAGTINLALKKNQINDAKKQLASLETELNTAIVSIRQLEKKQEAKAGLKDFDRPGIKKLMIKVLDALDQYNPQAIEPLIKELGEYISEDQLKFVIKYIDDLDFDNAKNEFIKLMELLHLN